MCKIVFLRNKFSKRWSITGLKYMKTIAVVIFQLKQLIP